MDDRRLGGSAAADVVAVEGDVEVADGHWRPSRVGDLRGAAGGRGTPAAVNTDQGERPVAVALDDLVRDSHQGASQVVGVEYDLFGGV